MRTLDLCLQDEQIQQTIKLTNLVFLLKTLSTYLLPRSFRFNIWTHSFPVHPFSAPWKHQKTLRFSKACNLVKERLWHRCFPVNFAKFLRTPFYRTPVGKCLQELQGGSNCQTFLKSVLFQSEFSKNDCLFFSFVMFVCDICHIYNEKLIRIFVICYVLNIQVW